MAKRAATSSGSTRTLRTPMTQEARESQLISLAYDLVEQRLLDGTASSQETTHFLKQGTMKYKLELEKLKAENALADAKRASLEDQKNREETYKEAIKAMRVYSGYGGDDEYDEEYDD